MKTHLLFLSFALAMPVMGQSLLRDTISLNRDWQFGRTRTSITQSVVLPHDFQISQPWVAPAADERADNSDAGANIKSRLSARGFKEMGEGWYRRTLTPPAEWRGRRVLLDFEGIMLVGDVYLNGALVGKTDYGYLGFDIDVSKQLRWGQPNELLVYASTQEPTNSRWYTGGGLYRNVNVVVTNPHLYFARHPLYITTSHNRTVSVSADIVCRNAAEAFSVKMRILDAEGNAVAQGETRLSPNKRWRHREYRLDDLQVPNAHLWDTDHPYLYTAELTLCGADGSPVDRIAEPFGIRTLEFSPAFGMKLNGRKVLLKGWANHHTLGALGAAAHPRAIEKRLRLMKSFGFNHVRTAHNPYSEEFLRLCDRLGILVVDELYDKWNRQYAGGRADFTALWQDNIPEFIRRDRNHPSVVMWSLGNELQQYADMPFNDWGVTLYRLQRQLLSRYDSTRLVTVAMHPRYRSLETDSLPAPLALATDVASYNYRYMYFPGDARRFPQMMFYQSEANAEAMGPNFFEMDLSRVIGLAYWGAIDYLGESHGWPAKGWRQGAFDISLQPKPTAYLLKSMFSDEPVVHIGVVDRAAKEEIWNDVNWGTAQLSESWNRPEGSRLSLYTYTNADEVELLLNGRSLGTQQNTREPSHRNKLLWKDVPYEAGTLEAVARTGGRVVARHRLETTGPATALRLEPDNPRWQADGQDLQHIRITAVDRQGRRVWDAALPLTFTIDGDADLVATDNGDITSPELHTAATRTLHRGTALVILRSRPQGRHATLTVNSSSLPRASVSMKMK